MSATPSLASQAVQRANDPACRPSFASALLELSKARLSGLVLLTTAIGYVLAQRVTLDWPLLGLTLLGTGLAAFGANAINQCLEVDRDRRMERTRGRPLPAGVVSLRAAWCYGLATAVAGPVILWAGVNARTSVLALGTVLLYVLVYTPLKVRTPYNTLVGALVGAVPPVIGWTAAAGGFQAGAWVLAAILFVWQIPHFLALAWVYREDYARGGFRMLPVVDRSGVRTCQAVVLYAATLVPATLMLTVVGVVGVVYASAALSLGAGLFVLAGLLYLRRTEVAARRVFLASVIYLPLLLGAMVVDRQPW